MIFIKLTVKNNDFTELFEKFAEDMAITDWLFYKDLKATHTCLNNIIKNLSFWYILNNFREGRIFIKQLNIYFGAKTEVTFDMLRCTVPDDFDISDFLRTTWAAIPIENGVKVINTSKINWIDLIEKDNTIIQMKN